MRVSNARGSAEDYYWLKMSSIEDMGISYDLIQAEFLQRKTGGNIGEKAPWKGKPVNMPKPPNLKRRRLTQHRLSPRLEIDAAGAKSGYENSILAFTKQFISIST